MGLFAALLDTAVQLFSEAVGNVFGGGFGGGGALDSTIQSAEENLQKIKDANSKIITPETLSKAALADERKAILEAEGLFEVPAHEMYYEGGDAGTVRADTYYNNILEIYDIGKEIEDIVTEKIDELKSIQSEMDRLEQSAVSSSDEDSSTDFIGGIQNNIVSQLNPTTSLLDSAGDAIDTARADAIVDEITETIERYEDEVNRPFVGTATSLERFLHEETSDLELAKLWRAKMDSYFEHEVHPEMGTTNKEDTQAYYDETLSQVMEAFRNWSSVLQYQIDLYGSQNLINATYEAVAGGKDAMSTMYEIIDINYRDYMAKKAGFSLNEESQTEIPYQEGLFGPAWSSKFSIW